MSAIEVSVYQHAYDYDCAAPALGIIIGLLCKYLLNYMHDIA